MLKKNSYWWVYGYRIVSATNINISTGHTSMKTLHLKCNPFRAAAIDQLTDKLINRK